jgi:hypothetical protein
MKDSVAIVEIEVMEDLLKFLKNLKRNADKPIDMFEGEGE